MSQNIEPYLISDPVKIKSRNDCFDFVKGIACILVIFMHCEFPGKFGILVQCVSRFCVPFFFMVSGYFSYYSDGRVFPAKKKIFHIGTICIVTALFYALYAFAINSSYIVTRIQIVSFLCFNVPFIIPGQLWFLYALLYVYILYAIVDKLKLQKFVRYSIPMLILLYMFLAQGCHIIGKHIPNMVYRNFLIEGFPLFMLGYYLHKNDKKIIYAFSNAVLLSIFFMSTALCIVERYMLGRDFGVNICSFPQVVSLFIFAMKNPYFVDNGKRWGGVLLGKKYSLFVYIIHPFVWQITECIYSKLNINQNIVAAYGKPMIVVVGTIFFSVLILKTTSIAKDKISI